MITKVLLSGDREVFRLQAVMDASLEELYDILSLRVEEAHRWNNSFQHVKVRWRQRRRCDQRAVKRDVGVAVKNVREVMLGEQVSCAAMVNL